MDVLQNKRDDVATTLISPQPDWASGLPANVMDLILDCVVSIADYIRFGAVCTNWYRISFEDRNKRNRPRGICRHHHHQLPMLLVPPLDMVNMEGEGLFRMRSYYSVIRGKVRRRYQYQIHYPYRNIGSSFGWLITLNEQQDCEIVLYNPFTYTGMSVPSPLTLYPGGLDAFQRQFGRRFNLSYFVIKAVLSADPFVYLKEYTMMLIYGPSRKLGFLAPGMVGWSPVDVQEEFQDITYSSSDGCFYAVDTTGQVTSICVDSKSFKPSTKKVLSKPNSPAPDHQPPHSDTSRYIVQSCDGDLLQVLRYTEWDEEYDAFPFSTKYKVSEFRVFKFDKGIEHWVELKSLGDYVLFLGDNDSICVLASDFPGCRPGSVYYAFTHRFSQECFSTFPPPSSSTRFDMGVFALEDGWCCPHLLNHGEGYDGEMRLRTPIWVVPTFFAKSSVHEWVSSMN